jgi:hypothetical protein
MILLDGNTGEILCDNVVYYRSETQIKTMKKKLKRNSNPFVFCNMDNIKPLETLLSSKEAGYLLALAIHIDYEGKIKRNYNSKPATINDIGSILKIKNKKYFECLIEKFIQLGILIEINGCFTISKEFFIRGKIRSNKVVKVYINEMKKLWTETTPAKFGLAVKLMPYIHYQSNMVVTNVIENCGKDARPMTKTDISNVTSIHKQNVSSYLSMPIIIETSVSSIKKSVYKFNSMLVSRV